MKNFQEIVLRDDNGLSYLLGFDKNVHPSIIDITKVYLAKIWHKRCKLLEERGRQILQETDAGVD